MVFPASVVVSKYENCIDSYARVISTITANETSDGNDLVFAVVISRIRQVDLLKACRKVCKAWDGFVCETLKILTYVSLREDCPKRYKIFQKLLQHREAGSGGTLANISLPFRVIHIHAASFTQETFINFLDWIKQQKNLLIIKKLCLTNSSRHYYKHFTVDLQNLIKFLKDHKDTLEEICYNERFSYYLKDDLVFNHLNDIDEIRLPSVRKVFFYGSCILNSRHSLFFRTLLQSCRLDVMEVDGEYDGCRVIPMCTSLNLANLTQFCIHCFDISRDAWGSLGTLQFPNLRLLALVIGDCRNASKHWHNFASLLSNVVGSLEALHTSIIPTLDLLPSLSKLREVVYHRWNHENKFSDLHPDKFPALKNATFLIGPKNCRLETPSCLAHYGVEKIILKENKRESDIDDTCYYELERFREFLLITVTQLAFQFPNVLDLTIYIHSLQNQQVLSSSLLAIMQKSFSQLKRLSLFGMSSDFSSMTGILIDLNNWTHRHDVPSFVLPRSTSLQDFTDLEYLDLGPQIVVTQDIITNCLSKIPKLKRIKFFRDKNLSMDAVQHSLGHLEQVEICNQSS